MIDIELRKVCRSKQPINQATKQQGQQRTRLLPDDFSPLFSIFSQPFILSLYRYFFSFSPSLRMYSLLTRAIDLSRPDYFVSPTGEDAVLQAYTVEDSIG